LSPKLAEKRKIIKIRIEISEINNGRTIEKIKETKTNNGFLKD